MNDEARTSELEQQALDVIKEHNLYFFKDIPAYLSVSRATLYNNGLDKLDSIRDALSANRVIAKVDMRKKWYASDHPTIQIALYRLIAEPEERRALSLRTHELSGPDGGEIPIRQTGFSWEDEPDNDELDEDE